MKQVSHQAVLSALLHPRTIYFVPRSAVETSFIEMDETCTVVRSGPADVVVILPGTTQQTLSRQRAMLRQAKVILVLEDAPALVTVVSAISPPRSPDISTTPLSPSRDSIAPLVLGPGSGLWTPSLQVALQAPSFRAFAGRPCLALTQGRAMARQLIQAAAHRGVNLIAVITTGHDHPLAWHQLFILLQALEPCPHLLLALHRPISFAQLALLGTSEQEVALLLAQPATVLELPLLPPGSPSPSRRALAAAFGIPTAPTPQELMELVALRQMGVAPRAGHLLAMPSNTEHAALLENIAVRSGIRALIESPGPARDPAPQHQVPGRRPPSRRSVKSRRAKQETSGQKPPAWPELLDRARHHWSKQPFDGMLLLDQRSTTPLFFATPSLFSLTPEAKPLMPLSTDALFALSALLRCQGRSPQQEPGRRPRARTSRARQLLDGWPSDLGEVQVKELLFCYGVKTPPEKLVGSASAAGQAAAQLGLPVALKATGPTLHHRLDHAAVVLAVPSALAARQAFRDVLYACRKLQPTPTLDGVLISTMVDLPYAVDCTLLWPTPLPPLLLVQLRWSALCASAVLALSCPLTLPDATRFSHHLLFGPRALFVDPARVSLGWLGDLLWRLSWLGAELSDRMLWLRLDTIAPPGKKHRTPLVIDAYGEQTESFRAPPRY